jgi:hypothetical protein
VKITKYVPPKKITCPEIDMRKPEDESREHREELPGKGD